jgi:hypothetical protein
VVLSRREPEFGRSRGSSRFFAEGSLGASGLCGWRCDGRP